MVLFVVSGVCLESIRHANVSITTLPVYLYRDIGCVTINP